MRTFYKEESRTSFDLSHSRKSKKTLVIFDCDGVLVDSEATAAIAVSETLESAGINLTPLECRLKFQGKSTADMISILEESYTVKLQSCFASEIEASIDQALSKSLKAIPNIESLLQKIQSLGLAICVASSGTREKVRKNLKRTNLLSYFEGNITSATEVKNGKPKPDVFVLAAKKMGFTCQEAIILEDSMSGIIAGVAAGAKVIAYNGDPFNSKRILPDESVVAIETMEEAWHHI